MLIRETPSVPRFFVQKTGSTFVITPFIFRNYLHPLNCFDSISLVSNEWDVKLKANLEASACADMKFSQPLNESTKTVPNNQSSEHGRKANSQTSCIKYTANNGQFSTQYLWVNTFLHTISLVYVTSTLI
jgi:hypothetical protein